MAKPSNTGTAAPSGSSPPPATGSTDRNSVQQARPRERKGAAKEGVKAEGEPSKRPVRSINSISAPRVRGSRTVERRDEDLPPQAAAKETPAKRTAGQEAEREAPAPVEDHQTVPDHVRQRFVQVGRKYYFPDGARAFTDRGRRLTTPSENTEVIRSLLTIAHARGWNEIVVRGTDSFRREAWFAARLMGLEVRGYRPTEVEQARLVRTLSQRKPDGLQRGSEAQPPRDVARGARSPGVATRTASQELIAGRLIEHGRAPFQHDRHQPISYFAKIETKQGERVIWGVDLDRAFKESVTKPKVGDDVGLRSVRKENVTVKAARRDPDGKIIGEQDLDTLRNRWIVEKSQFFEARGAAADTVRDSGVAPKDAVNAHPELVGTYLQIRAAELAAKRIKDPKDRTRFVSAIRSALADSVARGEPAPRVKLRERSASRPQTKTRTARSAEQAPARG